MNRHLAGRWTGKAMMNEVIEKSLSKNENCVGIVHLENAGSKTRLIIFIGYITCMYDAILSGSFITEMLRA